MAQSRQQAELRGQQRGEVGRAQPRQKTNMGSSTNAPATYPPPQKASQDAPLVANSKQTETVGAGNVEEHPQKNPDVDDIQEI